MKRFLLAIMAFVAVISAKAATLTGSLYQKDFDITYTSVDAQNTPITLSTKIYMPCKVLGYFSNYTFADIEFVVLNCHPTISHDAGCPTGSDPQLGAIKYMTSENAMVICPDYIGFGESNGKNHPYMCSTLTARNVLDAYKAAMEWVKTTKSNSGKVANFKDGWYTINIGYSQGGATALAFQRYLETEATQADREAVRLRGSLCGAGPYDQKLIFDIYSNRETIGYPSYLPYAVMGLYEAFGETTLRKLPIEQCFKAEFLNKTFASKSNKTFMTLLKEKETSIDDLNTLLLDNGFTNFYDIISEDYRDQNSVVYRSLSKALGHSNLLDGKWTPKAPVAFYHYNDDEVVPFEETQAAYDLFKNVAPVRMLTQDDYDISDNSNWDIAFTLGGYSRDLNHRNCGVYFYLMFLAGNLRPTATTYTVPNTDSTLGYVQTYTVGASDASAAKDADRITTAFAYDLPKGKPVFVQFASDVDGYYFGCNAPRFEVTLNENGEAVSYTQMDDIADFKAGKVYLLTAVDADENNILSMTAGVSMSTVASPLAWRELNMRAPLAAKGKSYISNYLPFAYTTPEGATAYAMTESSSDDVVLAKPFTTVPVGTGTLIETEEPEDMLVLSPVDASEGEAVSGNLLIGHYEDVTNEKTNYYHFGISDNDNPGYWRYPDMATVKAYSSYMNRPNASANGFTISFEDDRKIDIVFLTRLIDALINNTATGSYYDVNGDGKFNKADIEQAAKIILGE